MKYGDVSRMIDKGLEWCLLPKETLDALLEAGAFFLVMDGLSESNLDPRSFEDYLAGKLGRTTRLLVSIRPHPGYRRAIEASGPTLRVEPHRLDDAGFTAFESKYIQGDEQKRLSAEAKRACKATDGDYYLPILVRLAILVGGAGVRSVGQIYEGAFERLLLNKEGEADHTLVNQAGDLCVKTYWRSGGRILEFMTAADDTRPLLKTLWKAGILVSADITLGGGSCEPRQLRFFHDSMQSYLTARGLAQALSQKAEARNGADWGALPRAAGAPIFRPPGVVSGRGSELFQMCLAVFPRQEQYERLRDQLLQWAGDHDGELAINEIIKSVPETLQGEVKAVEEGVTWYQSGGAILRQAVERCGQEALEVLSLLYARVAPLVWPILEKGQG
jgi:hypothetical protein